MNMCKGQCKYYDNSRPQRYVFLTHARCRICEHWFPKKYKRCPCCNNLLAIRPRSNNRKREYIESKVRY